LFAKGRNIHSKGIDDLVRGPELQKSELVTLSEIGALNSMEKGYIGGQRFGKSNGPPVLPVQLLDCDSRANGMSPLEQMTDEERLVADFMARDVARVLTMTYCREAYPSWK